MDNQVWQSLFVLIRAVSAEDLFDSYEELYVNSMEEKLHYLLLKAAKGQADPIKVNNLQIF